MSSDSVCCAICLDNIDISLNVIKTECNHCFHSNCFLQNAAHNGFNCPMCRNELASVPEEEDESDYDEEEDMDEEEIERLEEIYEEEYDEGLENEGWTLDDTEYWVSGPLDLEEVKD